MKIRSITYFCNPGWPLDEEKLRAAGRFLGEAKAAYEAAGYEVQTTRLATIPFPEMLGAEHVGETPRLAAELSLLLPQIGVAYAALGPALPEVPASYAVIPEAIAASKNVFFSGVMADTRRGISLVAVNACAEVIVRCAPIDPNGFANLNFAALANVPPGAPFFPAAYWEAGEPAFAIATEAADLAVSAFGGSGTEDGGPSTVDEGRKILVASLEQHGQRLARIADSLDRRFIGVDFSLAPFPDDSISLGAAVEALGVPKVGLHGSLAAAAILTEAVDRADFPHTGFSGFMQPVLEDSVLARRAAEGTLTIKDALLYSAVCGTGLDTVPLPGDVSPGQVAALLLDLSALALRLDKPLTARLMPIPGKQAGDPTNFDFGFFANSRVMRLDAEPLQPPLSSSETFALTPRREK
jgi:uncharacterized protein (UPF0210 family)